MESDLLTTGQVAELCGVTPDAVLKWIKKGKIPATRTTGGHYRVSLDTVRTLGLARTGEATAPSAGIPIRCWEYFGGTGAPTDTCRKCFVYRARVDRCYEAADLGEAVGHNRRFCREDCGNCAFYRARKGLAIAVLVVTRDETLIRRLEKQTDGKKIGLRFARSGYECAAIIEAFHPAVVVMDSALPEVREGTLADSIRKDERIPGVKVVVARRRGDRLPAGKVRVPAIPAPFTAKQIEQIVDEQARPAGTA
ncbi:MAG: excisionase family DNA-binding protein [Planctomycetota bacterium]|jgi:excisionase family DNA binding protein